MWWKTASLWRSPRSPSLTGSSIKTRIISDYERVKLLTKITIDISVKTGEISFELPEFGLQSKETLIEPNIWENVKDELVSGKDIWGVIELGYRPPDDSVKPKIPGKIKLTDFQSFCPYETDLDFYKDVRTEFSMSEWLDILLGAIDYNADGYTGDNAETNKKTMLEFEPQFRSTVKNFCLTKFLTSLSL